MIRNAEKITWICLLSGLLWISAESMASAHFQMIIPSDDMVGRSDKRKITLDVMFWHPFEGFGMNMARPVQFGVLVRGKKVDLKKNLTPVRMKDRDGTRDAFRILYSMKKPGDHIFYVEPKPYWEASEEAFIVHYTKVVVNAFGMEEGWDEEVGLKTEIIPLTRPYGLYAGNVFQGIVKVDGKPSPFAVVEVEYYNKDGKMSASAAPLITQVIKTDANGVFTYGMPEAGWWGFAALNIDKKKMKREGKFYPLEIGAVLWIKTHKMSNTFPKSR